MQLTLATLLLFAVSVHCQAQFSSTRQEVAKQILTLKSSSDPAARRVALRSLNALSRDPEAGQLMSETLLHVIKTDPIGEIRGLAIEVLGHIKRQRGEPCPLIFIQKLFSEDETERNYATVYAGLFEKFDAGAADAVLPHLSDRDPYKRSDALMWLGIIGRNNPKTLAVLRRHTTDAHFQVRHSAHWAVYSITRKLEDILPYYIEVVAVRDLNQIPLPADLTEDEKRDHTQKNLIAIGVLFRLTDLVARNSPEFAQLLQTRLNNNSPATRQQTLVAIGKAIKMIADTPAYPMLPTLPRNDAGPKRNRSNLEVLKENFLKDTNIKARLEKLSIEDPDPDVRIAAAATLKNMDDAKNKKVPEPPAHFLIPSSPAPPIDESAPFHKLPRTHFSNDASNIFVAPNKPGSTQMPWFDHFQQKKFFQKVEEPKKKNSNVAHPQGSSK